MAKKLDELDIEFRARTRGAPLRDGDPIQAQPSKRLEELDRAFQARLAQNLERPPDKPRRRFLISRRYGEPRDKPAEAPPEPPENTASLRAEPEMPETETAAALPPLTQEERRAIRRRHIFSIVSNILFYGAMLTLVLGAWTFMQSGGVVAGNTRLYSVLTTSMQSVYPKGSLIFVQRVDPGELVVGNDITYYIDANTTRTHRITSIVEDYQDTGERAFETKGVNVSDPDVGLVREGDIVGRVVFFLPLAGAFLATFRERLWVIVLFFLSVVAFSFFLNLTLGETRQERRERRARRVLERAEQQRRERLARQEEVPQQE